MRHLRFLAVAAVAGSLAACAAPATGPGGNGPAALQPASAPASHYSEEGLASWYGPEWNGRKTASGEPFDTQKMTAAHPSLPLGTVVRVTNLENGRTAKVRINDRGPHVSDDKRRILDLTAHAAAVLGMKKDGVAMVRIEEVTSSTAADAAEPEN